MLIIFFLRWYQGFDWEGLEARTLTPPIIPKVSFSLRFPLRFIFIEHASNSIFETSLNFQLLTLQNMFSRLDMLNKFLISSFSIESLIGKCMISGFFDLLELNFLFSHFRSKPLTTPRISIVIHAKKKFPQMNSPDGTKNSKL